MRQRAVLLAAVLGAAGCRGEPPPALPASLRIAHESDIFGLDPGAVAETATHSILSNVYESLVTFDSDMRLVPGLALSWSNVDDSTWVVRLRPDVRFHDGTPLTSAEVKAALERARDDPGSAVRGHLATIRAVEVLDAGRLRLHTVRRDPLLVNRLTYVLLARRTEGPDGTPRFSGTGPYRVVRWDKGRVLETEAFAGHWRKAPPVRQVSFVPVEEGERSVEVLRRGEVQVLRYLPETLADRVRAHPGLKVLTRPGLTTYYLWFNTEPRRGGARNPFADPRVRRAVSLAVDRAALVRRVGGSGVPANQLVSRGVFGYVASLPELPYDPEEARRLLAAAGYGSGTEVELVHRAGTSVLAAAEEVREMLARVGIEVTLKSPPWEEIHRDWRAGQLGFFLAGWRFENGDAYSFLVDCTVTRDAAQNRGGYNPGFSSPALDALVQQHADIFGEASRLKHYGVLMRKAMEEMPLVPLYTRFNVYGVSERVEWEPRLDGRLLAAEMSLR